MSIPYVDTSALAKWYLNERGSEEFEAFILGQERAAISRVTALEFAVSWLDAAGHRSYPPGLKAR